MCHACMKNADNSQEFAEDDELGTMEVLNAKDEQIPHLSILILSSSEFNVSQAGIVHLLSPFYILFKSFLNPSVTFCSLSWTLNVLACLNS